VERRSGKYFGAETALRQISLATGGTLTLKHSVVFVGLTLDQFIFWPKLPPNVAFGIKNLEKKILFPGVTPPDLLSGRGRLPPAPTPSTATRRERGRKLPRCWDLSLGNRSPKSKFTTAPLSSPQTTSQPPQTETRIGLFALLFWTSHCRRLIEGYLFVVFCIVDIIVQMTALRLSTTAGRPTVL